MTDPTSNAIQVRVGDTTTRWLTDRAERMHSPSHHQQARTELEIWQNVLVAELRRIRLTLNQVNCLADVLNGTLFTPGVAGSAPIVYYETADVFRLARTGPAVSSYGAKWGIDEDGLLDYLLGLGPAADHALHDAVSRWWEAGLDGGVEGWATVGVRVIE